METYHNGLALNIMNLNKEIKTNGFSLKNINIEVPYGTIVGNIGRNGAGKSTTISCILGMLQKDSGEVKIFNLDYLGQIDVNKYIGVVLDEPNFSLLLTPDQINRVMKRVYDNWNEETFKKYLLRFALPFNQGAKNFSFGMKKKLSLAIALSHEPQLLILDEITSGLDPVSRDEILCILLEYIEKPENAIYMSSHITSDLEKIADYIIFMDQGEIVLSAEKDTLLYDYGIVRCPYEKIEEIDENDIVAYRREYQRIDILVKNALQIKNKYGDIIVNKPNFDEILLILTGE